MSPWLRASGIAAILAMTPVTAFAQANVSVPNRVCDVTTYGARGTRVFYDTEAFQRAIEDCHGKGGGTVNVPRGEYLIGPIFLRSNIRLHLAPHSELVGTTEERPYKVTDATRAYVTNADWIALINIADAENVAITGSGRVDGQGATWWDRWREQARRNLRGGSTNRPRLVHAVRSRNLLFDGVGLWNSPSFHLVVKESENVTVNRMSFVALAHSPNTDAIDPIDTRNMLITNNYFDVGDDVVAIKSLRVVPERPNAAVENIVIRGNRGRAGRGISIGSETIGGVRNVLVEDNELNGAMYGIRIKTPRERGGIVENIVFRNNRMTDVETPMVFSAYYESSGYDATAVANRLSADGGFVLGHQIYPSDAEPARPYAPNSTPWIRNVRIDGLTATGADRAGIVVGLPERAIEGLVLRNVRIRSRRGLLVRHAEVDARASGSRLPTGGRSWRSAAPASPEYRVRVLPSLANRWYGSDDTGDIASAMTPVSQVRIQRLRPGGNPAQREIPSQEREVILPRTVTTSFAATVSSGALIIAGLFAASPALAQTGGAATAADAQATTATQPPVVSTDATIRAGQPRQPASEPGAVEAADTDEPTTTQPDAAEIVVTGFRASLQNALNQKRRSDQIIDAITAEDIADFPDANLAESIQRLPGVSIDRDNGEGRSVTIRGLGGDFQMTRLNGADALAVAGGNSSDAGANRTRGFDFNTFASELFSNIRVTKTTAAVNDEGSLGAIIDLTTGRPLAYRDNRMLLGLEGEYRENGGTFNPRLTALVSRRITNNFGVLASVAYQEQRQQIDRYSRSIGSFEYLYRNSQIPGVTPATFGFARPSNQGTGPTFGSDPAAYALLSPTTIIPALPSINRQDLSYDRLGATATAQWRPTSRTEVVVDGVYSRYRQDSVVSGITPVGLNRNFPTGTGGANPRFLRTGSAGIRPLFNANGTVNNNGLVDRIGRVSPSGSVTRGLFPTCRAQFSECGQTASGGALIPGTFNSYNPRNFDVFDYYNSPVSPGFIPSSNNLAGFVPLLGRTNTKVREANVNEAGQADYLVLDDVDWRSSADAQFGETNFYQGTMNLTQEFGDRLTAEGTLGYSRSEFRGTGLLAEFNSLDRDNYVFDERGDGPMPVFSPGFDVSDPNQWTLVKGLSAIRYFNTMVDNEFRVARLNFAYEVDDSFTLRWGGTAKQFDFVSNQVRRDQDIEAINPTLEEAGLKITDLGRTIGFGRGLNVSPGTPTSMFVPDLNAFIREFGIDCNCVNEFADFRAVPDGRQNNQVRERDFSGFFQLDFNVEMFGRPLRGNGGLRVARTQVTGRGRVGATDGTEGIPVVARNTYWDVLPAMNANWEAAENFLIRFAASQTISRPQLNALTPGTRSFPNVNGGLNSGGAAPSITVGNPYLNPFRSTNFDLSFERYFGRSGLIGVTLFHKDLASFPQQIAIEVPLQAVFEEAIYEQLLAQFTNPAFREYIESGGLFAVRQFRDAPGGTIKGIEVNVQSDFGFLGDAFENFGITANYTHIESELNYLTSTQLNTRRNQTQGTAQNTFAPGPFLNTSPDAFNATIYYENDRFSARVSAAYRERYVNRFPLSAGTCSPGTTTNGGRPCNSPVIADFGYTEDTLNVDFASSYNLTDWIRLTFEARNLTNQTQRRTMYEANPVTQNYQSAGRVFTAGARLTF